MSSRPLDIFMWQSEAVYGPVIYNLDFITEILETYHTICGN